MMVLPIQTESKGQQTPRQEPRPPVDWPTDGKLLVPISTDNTATTRRLIDREDLHVASDGDYTTIFVSHEKVDPIATVIELDIVGTLQILD